MDYNTDWKRFWKQFLEEKSLGNYVSEMDEVDKALGNEPQIEKICHSIYEDYRSS